MCGQETVLILVKSAKKRENLEPILDKFLLKSLHQGSHVDIILLLLAHHLQEFIELDGVVQLVLAHGTHHRQQLFL